MEIHMQANKKGLDLNPNPWKMERANRFELS